MMNVIENVVTTISSRELADMIGIKRHSDMLEKIDGINKVLMNGNLRCSDYWYESSYKQPGNGKVCREYQVTKKGCELIAHKLTGEKGVLFTVRYMERFEQLEQQVVALEQQNTELYHVAISDKEHEKREYEAKKSRYNLDNRVLLPFLRSLSYTELESTINDIIDFHVNIMRKKDRTKSQLNSTSTEYKLYVHSKLKQSLSIAIRDNNSNNLYMVVGQTILLNLSNNQLQTINRSTSHIISNKDKQITMLSKAQASDCVGELTLVKCSPYSTNYMYTDNHHISWLYKKWMDKFPYSQLEARKSFHSRVDKNKPMKLIMRVVGKKGTDTDNVIKSFQDRLQDYYRFDDRLIKKLDVEMVGTVNKWRDCSISYLLENL